jgi:hypothetical protein
MALKRGEINPLNVLGLRKLDFIPEHFTRISIDHTIDLVKLISWIEYHLNSRYAIVSKFSLDSNRRIFSKLEIGFEDPKEITLLTLGCQHLYKT